MRQIRFLVGVCSKNDERIDRWLLEESYHILRPSSLSQKMEDTARSTYELTNFLRQVDYCSESLSLPSIMLSQKSIIPYPLSVRLTLWHASKAIKYWCVLFFALFKDMARIFFFCISILNYRSGLNLVSFSICSFARMSGGGSTLFFRPCMCVFMLELRIGEMALKIEEYKPNI